MRKSKFTPEQILQALRQAESGTTIVDICRKLGVTETTFYRWKNLYTGLDVSELRELKQLREENRCADYGMRAPALRRVLQSKSGPNTSWLPKSRCVVKGTCTASPTRTCRVRGTLSPTSAAPHPWCANRSA